MEPPFSVVVRDATLADAGACVEIYNPYVFGTVITFEVDPVSLDAMAGRIADVLGRGLPWLVAEQEGSVVGFAYAHLFRPRAAYLHTVETTIYLASDALGRGIGKSLYRALIERLRLLDIHMAIAGIALPNENSVALHESLGFVRVGMFPQVGRKLDQWIDLGFWQLALEPTDLPPSGLSPT
jgi:L-amino acid N-acyltransferase YncA